MPECCVHVRLIERDACITRLACIRNSVRMRPMTLDRLCSVGHRTSDFKKVVDSIVPEFLTWARCAVDECCCPVVNCPYLCTTWGGQGGASHGWRRRPWSTRLASCLAQPRNVGSRSCHQDTRCPHGKAWTCAQARHPSGPAHATPRPEGQGAKTESTWHFALRLLSQNMTRNRIQSRRGCITTSH